MVAWVVGHQIFDILALVLQPALFFAWLYVLTLPPIGAVTYYSVLMLVGWYTSGLGYLVSVGTSLSWLLSAMCCCCCDICSLARSVMYQFIYALLSKVLALI